MATFSEDAKQTSIGENMQLVFGHFLLTAAPLAVPGGTGSPLNPIATF